MQIRRNLVGDGFLRDRHGANKLHFLVAFIHWQFLVPLNEVPLVVVNPAIPPASPRSRESRPGYKSHSFLGCAWLTGTAARELVSLGGVVRGAGGHSSRRPDSRKAPILHRAARASDAPEGQQDNSPRQGRRLPRRSAAKAGGRRPG